jgi:GNAT superfamily N-acetyltransferase
MTDAERARLLALYEIEMRRDAWVPGLATHPLADVTRYHDAARREVLIMWHRFAAVEAEAVVRRELDYFKGSGGFTWKVYAGDEPRNLPDVLLAAGMEVERGEEVTLMVAPAAAMAAAPVLPPHANIRRLKSSADIALLSVVWEAVWPGGNGGWIDVLGEAMLAHADRLSIHVVMVDDVPVASGYLVLDPRGNFAYLGGGATLAAHRGKGLYRALVHARAALARDANIAMASPDVNPSSLRDHLRCPDNVPRTLSGRHLAIEASPASRPILARLGFEPLTTLRFYSRK